MKIRNKLAVSFMAIVVLVLALFASITYYVAANNRRTDFYEQLEEKAKNYARLIIKTDTLKEDLIRFIDRNTGYLENEKITVIDKNNHQVFNTFDQKHELDYGFLEEVRKVREKKYLEDENEALAIFYPDEESPYVVIVSALDKDGYKRLYKLKMILVFGFLIGALVSLIAGWVFAGQALNPLSLMVRQVEQISATNLQQRINEGNGSDELAQLAITFNSMLSRLQIAFENQKNFVANSSHELRTPLTSITGQLEVALMRDKSKEEYVSILHSVLEDIRKVNRLTNGLLELANADLNLNSIKLKHIRIDELLWETRTELIRAHSSYKISIELKGLTDNEDSISVLGNAYLLRSAFINLMDNACKFSPDNSVKIIVSTGLGSIQIDFINKAEVLSNEELSQLNKPFYRAPNSKGIPGNGLGFSLAHRVIGMHQGHIKPNYTNGNFIVHVKLNSLLNV